MTDIRGPAATTRNAGPVVDEAAPERPRASPPAPVQPSAPEPTTRPAPPPQRSGGFLPLLLGGIAAALVGFAVANFAVPEGWPRPETPDPEVGARLTGLEAGLEELAGRVDGFAARLDDIEQTVSEGPAADAVAGLSGELDAVRGEIAALGDTVAGLEPGGGGAAPEMPDFTGAFNDQMSQFEDEIARVTTAAEAEVAAARAEAEATRAAAETAREQAALRAALADIETALDTGAPFSDAVGNLDGLGVPEALTSVAGDGLTPLSELQRTFPDAARAALQAAARGPEETAGPVDRVTSFFLAQTNARSLEPRDGDDADAVLSRAEAALRSGDLGAALAEIDTLGEGPKAALGEWLDEARRRQAAADAVETLTADIDEM